MDNIRLSSIINECSQFWPLHNEYATNYEKPTIAYTYDTPIRHIFCNYRQSITQHVSGNTYACVCDTYPSKYIDPFHKHIITADFNFITDKNVKDLLLKGPKYRLSKSFNLTECKLEIENALFSYVEKICKRLRKDSKLFDTWIFHIILLLEQLTLWPPTSSSTEYVKTHTKNAINKLKENFVFTITDKASQNFSIICKDLYFKLLDKELQTSTIIGTKVYEETSNMSSDLLKNILSCKSRFLYHDIPPDLYHLPFMHILTKEHKIPKKTRTIISSKVCITKPISKTLQLCLKRIQQSRKNLCQNIFNYSGINTFWIIDNNQPILNTINAINAKRSAKSIATYDFENMYTNIDHDQLIEEISYLIKTTLKCKLGMRVIGNRAIFCNVDNSTYNSNDLCEMVKFVVSNTFFTVGDKIFKQIHGIPMGTSCAPQLANLFLHSLEYKYMISLMRTNFKKAKLLSLTYRYIDDITNFNGGDTLGITKHDIYPNVLNLVKVNASLSTADVLDITISKSGTIFNTKLFDKRRNFNFEVTCFPHFQGNIPKQVCVNTFMEQILRFEKLNSFKVDFISDTKTLVQLLLRRGYSKRLLKESYLKTINKHKSIIRKYKLNYLPF